MENGFMNKIIGLVLVLVIGATLVGGLLVPTVQAVTATETTFENEGYYSMDKLDPTTTATIEWAKATPNIVTINGKDVDMSAFAELNKSYTLIGSESIIVRYQKETATEGIQVYSSEGYTSFHLGTSDINGDKLTITVSNGTLNFETNGSTPLTKEYTNLGEDGYIINGEGTGAYAVMKKSTVPAHVLKDSEIRLIGVSVKSGPTGIAIYGAGTIEGGITLSTIYAATGSTVTYSEPVVTDAAINGYEDLYKLEKYQFTITYSNGQDVATYDVTYSYFIVPAAVTAEKTQHMDASQIAIFGVVGLLGIVLLVTIAASAVRSKY